MKTRHLALILLTCVALPACDRSDSTDKRNPIAPAAATPADGTQAGPPAQSKNAHGGSGGAETQ